MKCIFCNIVEQKTNSYKVWENDDFIAFLDKSPIKPGHILLIPKTHFKSVFDLPESLYVSLFLNIKKIETVLKKVTLAKRIGIAIEGFGVEHAHVHLVPVNQGNDLNPEKAQECSNEELLKMQELLKKAFEKNKL